ncbi:Oidioi.mRNA.OKI2018_I69.chr2.g7169.t1.cds [Oikopleura dioica]|uniref:Oidioi.mRNA.OKI2018_I69.chr2.g7169.t1.cds n=1 Tax=Oikopleura dioica TaxID=34765 RepID=A0ABN7T5A6_OIKDI|nr:Oidioi.mRNA.OKI2018_I69.chr2.g7169.t1.cds [Oikopleura dioica]
MASFLGILFAYFFTSSVLCCTKKSPHVELDLDEENVLLDLQQNFTRKVGSNEYTNGRVYHFPQHSEYFGYTRPLVFADGSKFCEAFRGSLIVPETDEEMLLAQSLGMTLHEDFFKSGSKEETERITKFEFDSNNLSNGVNKMTVYSSSSWESAKEELLNVICVNSTELNDIQNLETLTLKIVSGVTNYNASNVCEDKFGLSTPTIDTEDDFRLFYKIVEMKLGFNSWREKNQNASFDNIDEIITFSENQTVKFLIQGNARMLKLAARGRNDVLMQLDTKIGLASLLWERNKPKSTIGKWEIESYDPALYTHFVLCKANLKRGLGFKGTSLITSSGKSTKYASATLCTFISTFCLFHFL